MARRKIEAKELPKRSRLRVEKGYRWVVDYRTDEGARRRKFFVFGELEIAKAYAEAKENARDKRGVLAEAVLDDSTLEMATRCVKSLREKGKSLDDATTFYLEYLARRERSVTVSELWRQYFQSKQDAKKSAAYLQQIEIKLKAFEREFGDRMVGEIQTEEIADYLNDLSVSPNTIQGHFRVLRNFWNYALRRRYAFENPVIAAKEDIPQSTESEKHPLPIEKAAELLTACSDQILPAVAIQMFTGIRTAEAKRLDWKDVDLTKSRILLRREVTKSGRQRFAHMPDNLMEWINPLTKRRGPVRPQTAQFELAFRQARESVGLKEWRTQWHNALRDSFATYHLAKNENTGNTAFAMGHTAPGLVQKHYAELATPEEAEEFFNIRPSAAAEAKVTQVQKKAAKKQAAKREKRA